MKVNAETRGGRLPVHHKIVANEAYLANPNIVGVQNPNVNPARGIAHWYGHNPLSPHVLPGRTPLKRF